MITIKFWGYVKNIEIEDNKIIAEIEITNDFYKEQIEKGTIKYLSIGFKPKIKEKLESGFHYKKWKLEEVSLTLKPVNEETIILLNKSINSKLIYKSISMEKIKKSDDEQNKEVKEEVLENTELEQEHLVEK